MLYTTKVTLQDGTTLLFNVEADSEQEAKDLTWSEFIPVSLMEDVETVEAM